MSGLPRPLASGSTPIARKSNTEMDSAGCSPPRFLKSRIAPGTSAYRSIPPALASSCSSSLPSQRVCAPGPRPGARGPGPAPARRLAVGAAGRGRADEVPTPGRCTSDAANPSQCLPGGVEREPADPVWRDRLEHLLPRGIEILPVRASVQKPIPEKHGRLLDQIRGVSRHVDNAGNHPGCSSRDTKSASCPSAVRRLQEGV